MTTIDLATWLGSASTRKGYGFTITAIQEDINGNPSTIVGTINVPAQPAVAAAPGIPAQVATPAVTINATWNASGTFIPQNMNYDLVKNILYPVIN